MALVWWCGEAADQSWAAWGGVPVEAGPVEATQELGAGTSVPELSPTPRPGETWPYTPTQWLLYTLHYIHTQLHFVMDQTAIITF